jgi:hypothetical protein
MMKGERGLTAHHNGEISTTFCDYLMALVWKICNTNTGSKWSRSHDNLTLLEGQKKNKRKKKREKLNGEGGRCATAKECMYFFWLCVTSEFLIYKKVEKLVQCTG